MRSPKKVSSRSPRSLGRAKLAPYLNDHRIEAKVNQCQLVPNFSRSREAAASQERTLKNIHVSKATYSAHPYHQLAAWQA